MRTFLRNKNIDGELINLKENDDPLCVSTAFYTNPLKNFALQFKEQKWMPFLKTEMIGTTIITNNPLSQPQTEAIIPDIGYFNDDYDMQAKTHFTKSFKVKVKIRSTDKLQPKVFLNDELNELL